MDYGLQNDLKNIDINNNSNAKRGIKNLSYEQKFSQFKSMKNKKRRALVFSIVGIQYYIGPAVIRKRVMSKK